MKRFLMFSVILLLVGGIGNGHAVANTTDYQINSVQQLLSETEKISNNQTNSRTVNTKGISKEEQILIDNTAPSVLEEYRMLLENEIRAFSISDETTELGSSSEKTFELPKSGAKITVTTESISIPKYSVKDDAITPLALINVKFGTRSYQIKYKITAALYPDSICGLVTTYTVKKDGLRTTGSSNAGTLSIFPTTIKASNKITDNRAEKIGYDINAQGDYNVTIGGYNGIGLVSFDMTITSTIRWDASTSTSLHLTEKYSQIGDKTK